MSPAVFTREQHVPDGEEEDGDDDDAEMETEEQGEEGDATEKVLGQQIELCNTKNSTLFQQQCLIFRTVMMRTRRWGTCSWPGRCWNWPKSFTKGTNSEATGVFKYGATILTLSMKVLIFFFFFSFLRKDTKEEQLMAAQAHLKLGEVSAESGMYFYFIF